MDFTRQLKQYYSHLEELYRLRCVSGLLGWDQQVFMPPKAAQGRAEQQETLGKIIHQRQTDPVFVGLVDDLCLSLDRLNPDDQVNVKESKRSIDRAKKQPEDFVAEQTRVNSISYVEWTKARPANDFEAIRPHLEKNFDLARREAEYVGYQDNPYDALLDTYEPKAQIKDIKPLLERLAEQLSLLVPQVMAKLKEFPEIEGNFSEDAQHALCRRIASDMGYDFEAGRLDKTHHPFESTIGPGDVRITTRYDSANYLSSVFTSMHEAGHALYEQGLPSKWRGSALGSPISLGIHESQSRLWENVIGRSREFSKYLQRVLPEYLPQEAAQSSPEKIWSHTNRVRPSLIRVEADEVTYSLHVVIRMLLEEALINNRIKVKDLPAAWNELYRKYLNLAPHDDRDGVLQDVHWYAGMIGYFPTYALGNLYGALIMEAAREALPNLDHSIEAGRFSELLAWLRVNVHQHGMRYTGRELIKKLSKQDLSEEPFVNYIKQKFSL